LVRRKYYVTTPIYYVNDVPHIGHAYSTIAADTIARFKRLAGYEVLFLTGTDEHGQKVERAAKERELSPQKHCDQMVTPFKKLWKRFHIKYDDFIRTTEKRHEQVVQSIFSKLYEKGDIYKGFYEGWYCVYEETFYAQAELVEGRCPECGREVEWLKEESYFFRSSKYIPTLLAHLEKQPDFVRPDFRRNEVLQLIKSGVQDVSVSRTTFKWGIPVPFDKKHVIYVWFDALINYLTGAGYLLDERRFSRFWPADVHIIGKDILRFHTITWPTMLLALGVPLPRQVFATGFWTLGGEKISKSRGVVIEPNALIDEFGADAIRYFLLREISFGLDGEFTREALIRRINDDLANDLGNLLHRSIPMFERYFNSSVPEAGSLTSLDRELQSVALETPSKVEQAMDRLDFREALVEIWKLIGRANKYIDEAAPWSLAKEGNQERLKTVMNTLIEAIRIVSILISPIMPETAEKIWTQLGLTDFERQTLKDAASWGRIKPGTKVSRGKPLFPRIEISKK
jgi:methionyl-tRNA synthetase